MHALNTASISRNRIVVYIDDDDYYKREWVKKDLKLRRTIMKIQVREEKRARERARGKDDDEGRRGGHTINVSDSMLWEYTIWVYLDNSARRSRILFNVGSISVKRTGTWTWISQNSSIMPRGIINTEVSTPSSSSCSMGELTS